MPVGINITNPYGETKYFQEKMLNDYAKSNPSMSIIILRYFNPVAAHPSGLIGENPNGTPNNLFPFLLKVVSKEIDVLTVFGNTYDTADGTCIRDFIHVMDLAEGHSVALQNMKPGVQIYNVGSGKGTSVQELINTFQKVNNVEIPHIIADKREGDVKETYACVDKIFNELNWKTTRTIEDICRDGYNYAKMNAKSNP
jgi:UDP-glucose 4-epimerase